MMRKRDRTSYGRAAILLLGLTACAPAVPEVEAPQTALAFEAEARTSRPAPIAGRCWGEDLRPALFETVTEQRQIAPERRHAEGRSLAPARFASESHQREVRPRQTIWFPVPCPADLGREDVFIASLQRALKARGYYAAPVTGLRDAVTQEALRRYQAANGLDSAVLSLAAARALGLVASL